MSNISMITSQTWRYRGKHTIQCSIPSTVAASSLETAALSDDGDTNRVQPKSQLEKRIDALEKKLAEQSHGSCIGRVAITERVKSVSIFNSRIELTPINDSMTMSITAPETDETEEENTT